MSQAKHAKGTLIQVETAEGSGVYSTIPETKDIQGPNLSSTEHDVTTHDTVGLGKEILAGLVDPGTVSFSVNEIISNALHQQLMADKLALTERNYRKVWPTGHYIGFRAQVKTWNPSHPTDGPHTAQVELRLMLLHGSVTAP